MGGADDKSVWERIAELGFADAVESRGFKRVGKTHWRLDGDGIVHHVKLYRGFSVEPGSFRDFGGVYIPGLDEMYRKLGEPGTSLRLPYGSALCHFESNIYGAYWRAEEKRYRAAFPDVRVKTRAWIPSFVRPNERPDFESAFLRPLPHWAARLMEDKDSGAWLTDQRELSDVADVVSQSWLKFASPDIALNLKYDEYYWNKISTSIGFFNVPDVENFMLARLAEDWEAIENLADNLFSDANRNFETELLELRRRRLRIVDSIDWKSYLKTDAGKRRIEHDAMMRVVRPLYRARKILRHSAILDYRLHDPGLNFSPLTEFESKSEYPGS